MNKYADHSRIGESVACLRKVRYPSKEAAEAKRLGDRKGVGSSYRCPYCRSWHLTKKNPT